MPHDQIVPEAVPPPIPGSYWVVPGHLLAGEYPGSREESDARCKLRLFLDAGFTFFLDPLSNRGRRGPAVGRCVVDVC